MFENVDIQNTHTHTHMRSTEAYLTNEPKGSGELKLNEKRLFEFHFKLL